MGRAETEVSSASDHCWHIGANVAVSDVADRKIKLLCERDQRKIGADAAYAFAEIVRVLHDMASTTYFSRKKMEFLMILTNERFKIPAGTYSLIASVDVDADKQILRFFIWDILC
ncbi:MAG: hypothetical protein N838_33635 [Thiohalocapsa sp. PB-PSB1]|jgi:hypothetical protein|nr:MAG: hypothetical protein N838_33635 [Thiohalocapsa sp. PB-PSB1]